MSNSVHRDDLSPELISDLESKFPGFKIVCTGDISEEQIPPEALAAFEAIEKKYAASFHFGTCVDCGMQMPNYPATVDEITDDWQPAEGWSWFEKQDVPVAWQCPGCNKPGDEMFCQKIL
jgi:hypothetical protein